MLHVAKTGDTMHPAGRHEGLAIDLARRQARRDATFASTIKGRYPNFTGGYEYLISPEGEIAVQSSFTYSGEDFHARETGIVFTVPRQCELLEWDRQAEFSVYPPDHIGRPHGQAKPVADHGDESAADVGLVGRQLAAGLCGLPLDEAAYQLGDAAVSRLGRRRAVPIERLAERPRDRRWRADQRLSSPIGTAARIPPASGSKITARESSIKNGQVLESTVKFRFLPPAKPEERNAR